MKQTQKKEIITEICLESNFKHLLQNSTDMEEINEYIDMDNPFINREIAKNTNISEEIMENLLKHSAFTMNLILAHNPNITNKIKEQLYSISENEYKDSMLKKDLDAIFSGNEAHIAKNILFNLF
jgi:hypothetical protein